MTARERPSRGTSEQADGGARGTTEEPSNGVEPPPFRIETVTFESEGVRCAADLYLPTDGEQPWPAVAMAHVFGAERTWGLPAFAERFAAASFAAFVFDYRHLGGSDGEPRRLVDPARQLEDWDAALDYIRSLDEVDEERVAVWGSSFSGGHALEVARRDSAVRAVVAQVPFVDGRATVAHQTSDRSSLSKANMAARALADRALAAVGLGPVCVPMVSEPGDGGLVDSPGAEEGFLVLVPEGDKPVNLTPARVVLDLPYYRPGLDAGQIDVPVHVVVAGEDCLLPPGPTERLIDRLRAPSVQRVPTGHFDVHRAPWLDRVVDRQVAFLSEAMAADSGSGEP